MIKVRSRTSLPATVAYYYMWSNSINDKSELKPGSTLIKLVTYKTLRFLDCLQWVLLNSRTSRLMPPASASDISFRYRNILVPRVYAGGGGQKYILHVHIRLLLVLNLLCDVDKS
jgi:hypothetical protein